MSLADIDWGRLFDATIVSAAFGIGVIVVAGVAVVASLCAQDRRSFDRSASVAFQALTIACMLGIAAAITLGIYIMTSR
jgi:hypothetical protein